MTDENDLAPSFDFTAAANEAIEATTADTPPEEVVEEAPVEAVERARNADGTFAATATESEPAAEETPPENWQAKAEALAKRLADKDEFINRQGNELGDLRKQFEERFDNLEQRQANPAQRVTPDLIDNDPATATRLAWSQNDQVALGAAYEAWKIEDPASAGAWAAYTAAQTEMQAMAETHAQEMAALRGEFAPLTAASVEQHRAAEVRALTAEVPVDELTTFLESPAFAGLAQEFGLEEALADPARSVSAIKNLFYVHRGRNADTLNRTVQEVARTTAQEAEQATQDAYVASATTATATTAEQKTAGELIADRLTARFADRSSDNGWSDR